MEVNFTTESFNDIFEDAKVRMIYEIKKSMGIKKKIMFKVSMKDKSTFESFGSVCMLSVSAENEETEGVRAIFTDNDGEVCSVSLYDFTIEDIFMLGRLIEDYGIILDD